MCSIFASRTFHIKMQMKADMSEEELSLQCQRGDMRARHTLYERYGGALMAICLRYIGDRETAEDILHDGFLRIFQSIKQFSYQGEGSLKAWLSRVMVNEALGYLRKKNTQVQQEVLMTEIPDVPDTDDSELDDIPRSVLMKFISELPDGYRTVFNLYVFEDKSHKEIASLLGITEHTSSSQFYRAKSLLIKKINEYRKRKLE